MRESFYEPPRTITQLGISVYKNVVKINKKSSNVSLDIFLFNWIWKKLFFSMQSRISLRERAFLIRKLSKRTFLINFFIDVVIYSNSESSYYSRRFIRCAALSAHILGKTHCRRALLSNIWTFLLIPYRSISLLLN